MKKTLHFLIFCSIILIGGLILVRSANATVLFQTEKEYGFKCFEERDQCLGENNGQECYPCPYEDKCQDGLDCDNEYLDSGLPGSETRNEETSSTSGGIELQNPIEAETITEIIEAIISFLMWFGSGVAIIMIIWSSILYITAGGSEDKVTTARKNLIWTLVGLAILLAAEGIIAAIKSIFTSGT